MARPKRLHNPNPPIIITPEQIKQIETMAAIGLNMTQMAAMLGFSKDTLENRANENPELASAIEKGRATAIFQVGKTAYQQATSGEVPAMTMFYLKCRAGWKETQVIEARIQAVDSRKLAHLSNKQIHQLEKILEQIEESPDSIHSETGESGEGQEIPS